MTRSESENSSTTTTMAPRRHEASPRSQRRGAYRRGGRSGRARAPIGSGVRRELVRNALIESRLTPNAISLTGLALNLLAAALVWEQLFFLGGVAFVIGSTMDTLDGRYSRMSGKGPRSERSWTPRSTASRRGSC